MKKNDYIYLFLAFILGYFAQSIIKQRCGTVIEGSSNEETETGDYFFRPGGFTDRDTCINITTKESCKFPIGRGGKDAKRGCKAGEYEGEDRHGEPCGEGEDCACVWRRDAAKEAQQNKQRMAEQKKK
jgi:hypothetical protein